MKRKIAAMILMALSLSVTSAPVAFGAETAAEASEAEASFKADVVQHIKNGEIKGSIVSQLPTT